MPQSWRRNAKVFEDRATEYDSWFEDSLLFEIETAAIDALLPCSTSSSLEIGVGPGRFAQAFGTVFGIDPARDPLEIARSRNLIPCQAIGEALPFLRHSVARISLFFTLCFLTNPLTVLREVHLILQDSGQLIIGFVPAESTWGRGLQRKKEAGHPFYKYANFSTSTEVIALLRTAGFTVKTARSTLYQSMDEVEVLETPAKGVDGSAGFVALLAVKEYLT